MIDIFAKHCRDAIPEGIVLLENENILPLRKNEKVAIFGRAQFEYLKGGSGSGGRVNCSYVAQIPESLNEHVNIDSRVSEFYKDFIQKNPYDSGDGWQLPTCQKEAVIEEDFIKLIAESNETAIYILQRMAGEGYDLAVGEGGWLLSNEENNVIKLLSKHFRRFIVLVNSAGIIDMSWVKTYDIKAVALIWGGGQEGGKGVADMLMGINPPSGRLTDTIAKNIEDYPAFKNFGDADKNVHTEDIFVGYRYFETFCKNAVLYPFGYGKNYTTFKQTLISCGRKENFINLQFSVENVGKYIGKEVIQVYFSAPQGMLGKPSRELIAFKKTKLLKPNENQILNISFDISQMACYDDCEKTQFPYSYLLEKGCYRIFAGSNVRDAEEIFSFELNENVCVQKCKRLLTPVEKFDRMIATENGIAYEAAPICDNKNPHKGTESLCEITYTGNRGISLQQVKENEYTLDEFIAQFTAEELSYLAKGEGMSSPKAPLPGTASSFAGVAKPFFEHGVPVVSTCDGPAGMRIECAVPATSIPMGTLLACAWAPELFEGLFDCFVDEMLKYHIDVNLGPGMNIHRHPLCGRNFEYFSEDPLITGSYASMIVKRFALKGGYSTLKHFAVNSQEFERGKENEVLSERALREIYLKGFEMAVKTGYVRSIMTSYNRINGVSACSNHDLITKILREEWGYTGFVMTDWWTAIDDYQKGTFSSDNLAAMIEAQTDVFMPVPNTMNHTDDLIEQIRSGRISLALMQRMAKNVLNFVIQSHAFSRGKVAFEENDFSNISESIYETDEVQNEKIVTPGVSAGAYIAEITYNAEGDLLAQMTVKIFIDKNDAIVLILNKTDGKDAKTRCRVLLSENSSLYISGEGIKSLKLLQVR